jgi:hypothetical protein
MQPHTLCRPFTGSWSHYVPFWEKWQPHHITFAELWCIPLVNPNPQSPLSFFPQHFRSCFYTKQVCCVWLKFLSCSVFNGWFCHFLTSNSLKPTYATLGHTYDSLWPTHGPQESCPYGHILSLIQTHGSAYFTYSSDSLGGRMRSWRHVLWYIEYFWRLHFQETTHNFLLTICISFRNR